MRISRRSQRHSRLELLPATAIRTLNSCTWTARSKRPDANALKPPLEKGRSLYAGVKREGINNLTPTPTLPLSGGGRPPPTQPDQTSAVPTQISNNERVAVERIERIARVTQRFEPHGAGVHHQKPSDESLTESDDFADRFQRHHRS